MRGNQNWRPFGFKKVANILLAAGSRSWENREAKITQCATQIFLERHYTCIRSKLLYAERIRPDEPQATTPPTDLAADLRHGVRLAGGERHSVAHSVRRRTGSRRLHAE